MSRKLEKEKTDTGKKCLLHQIIKQQKKTADRIKQKVKVKPKEYHSIFGLYQIGGNFPAKHKLKKFIWIPYKYISRNKYNS